MAIYIGEHKYEDNHGEDGMEQQGPDSPQPNSIPLGAGERPRQLGRGQALDRQAAAECRILLTIASSAGGWRLGRLAAS